MRPQRGVLLDTHVLFWALNGAREISQRLVSLLNSERPLYFSAVSMVEVAIKAQRGTLPELTHFLTAMLEAGFRELTLDSASADAITRFSGLAGHDPFDRMLVGQAAAHSLDLETADQKLLSLKLPFIRDAIA